MTKLTGEQQFDAIRRARILKQPIMQIAHVLDVDAEEITSFLVESPMVRELVRQQLAMPEGTPIGIAYLFAEWENVRYTKPENEKQKARAFTMSDKQYEEIGSPKTKKLRELVIKGHNGDKEKQHLMSTIDRLYDAGIHFITDEMVKTAMNGMLGGDFWVTGLPTQSSRIERIGESENSMEKLIAKHGTVES